MDVSRLMIAGNIQIKTNNNKIINNNKEYKSRHDNMAIFFSFGNFATSNDLNEKRVGITINWYGHKREIIIENQNAKILWDLCDSA